MIGIQFKQVKKIKGQTFYEFSKSRKNEIIAHTALFDDKTYKEYLKKYLAYSRSDYTATNQNQEVSK